MSLDGLDQGGTFLSLGVIVGTVGQEPDPCWITQVLCLLGLWILSREGTPSQMCEFMAGLGELPLGASGTRRVPQSWTIWMSAEGNPSGLPCTFFLHRGRWGGDVGQAWSPCLGASLEADCLARPTNWSPSVMSDEPRRWPLQ